MIGGSFGTAVFGAIYAIVFNHTIRPDAGQGARRRAQGLQPADAGPGGAGQAEVDRGGT